jgi:hypothetical protein
MKTLSVFFLIAAFGLTAFAAPGNEGNYIVTRDGKVIFSKFSMGMNNARVKPSSSEGYKVSKSDILSYKLDNRVFEKKQLYRDNKATGQEVFMELICVKNGLKFYRLESSDVKPSKEAGLLETEYENQFFVFNGDQYLLKVDKTNMKTICNFFENSGS